MAVLKITNLSKNYGRKHVLHNVSFEIPKGQILGLIGPNGAGKSTIMKTIVGLTSYSLGVISIDGEELSKNNRKALASVGTMIETPALYDNLTGVEHLHLYNEGSTTNEEIQEIMEETQIEKFAKNKAKKYSLGMRQRLGIAITLLNHPKLLILDEPMNGLDPQSTHDLRDLLLKLANRGISILISSHLLDELSRIADSYVVINHGRVVKQASANEFMGTDKQLIKFETDNMAQTVSVLTDAGMKVHVNDRKVEVPDTDDALNRSLVALVNANIKINDVQKSQADLEESLLKLLTADNQKEEK
ncbi:ABC transporter ATP-binding protein [Lactobacillus sp. Sy-1]|uniref:ABC transporter ATP-binding protein n=1 Tax=Lactobacillus sp. Sy-1 TaxID=2109645 RepID=UPI001C579FA2|nr:ATP-binding cassette domain-containing protein [Lactobacillus sp. Sy-1]MBW1605129.1 ATP-binding cassette domain-containing protein [Lactobacillus sp. Sy-1]